MDNFRPSATALRVAKLRADHQTLEHGAIFADPFACAILGQAGRHSTDAKPDGRSDRRLRLFVAARSRLAEDALAAAVGRGVRQAVVLGAGLDTLALRNPHSHVGLRILEVDHPATQGWKRECLAAAGLAEPATVTFVAVDFERQTLADELAAAGYRSDLPAFFIWLGVVPYLTRDAIFDTLAFIGRTPGSEVVLDYGEPPETLGEAARAIVAEHAARAASVGEPWISFFAPAELAGKLSELGFDCVDDLASQDIAARFFGAPKGTAAGAGGHIVHARRSV